VVRQRLSVSVAAFKLDNSESKTLCFVIGLGLVGSEIAKSISCFSVEQIPLTQRRDVWQNAQQLAKDIIQASKRSEVKKVELVWAAGRAGFGATVAEMEAEFSYYSAVVGQVGENLCDRLIVSLISSAGGIYENSGVVSSLDAISPSRPYAEFKLKQEEHLLKLGIKNRLYRVSSIYGHGGSRVGLINAMLNSANNRQPMIVYAKPNTLRDYVYNVDIASQITRDILATRGFGLSLLASGRPTSITSLLNMVRQVTKKPVLASFVSDGSNDKNIVFERSLIIRPFLGTSLEEGVSLFNKRLCGGIECFRANRCVAGGSKQ